MISKCETIVKYETNDAANETLPVPTGNNILETYGKVINGKMNDAL